MSRRVLWLVVSAVLPAAILIIILTSPNPTSAAKTNQPSPIQSVTNASTVIIDAVLYDGLELNDTDEAVRIQNISGASIDIGSWQLYDGVSKATIPVGTNITPGQTIWLARNSAFFARQFGFLPDFEVTDSSPSVPNLSGTWPGFSNTGDEVILLDDIGVEVDVLIYEGVTRTK